MSVFEMWMVVLTAVAIIVAGVTGGAIFWQGNIASRTLDEVKKGGTDTHDLAVAAGKQSDSTKIIAEAAKTQAESASKVAQSTSDEVRQLAANVKEAQAANQQAKRALQVSERPWLTAERLEFTRYDPTQEPLVMEPIVVMKNTGKSVATDAWVRGTAEPHRTETLLTNWREPCRMIDDEKNAIAKAQATGQGEAWPHGFVLAPGDTVENDLGLMHVNSYILEKSNYSILGCATYEDEFGVPHHTNFCFEPILGEVQPKFKRCGRFEEAN